MVMFSIQKTLTFASYISGNEVLRLILWIHGFMLLAMVVNLVIFSQQLHSVLFTTELNWYIPALIFYLTSEALPLYILSKGIKQKSKSLLGWFTIAKSVMLFSAALIAFVIIRYGPLKDYLLSKFMSIVTIFTHGFYIILNISTIYVVYIYYKKLESPIIIFLRRYCHFIKESESADAIDPLKNITVVDDSTNNSRGDSYQLNDFILNPFDVSIDTGNILGEGQFGTVYKGNYVSKKKEKLKIAAKFAKDVGNSETLEMLLQEIKIIISVGNHENVIKFYGVTSDASIENHLAIITEFVSFGCLLTFLQENRHTFVDFIRTSAIGVHSDKPLVYINLDKHGTHSTLDLISLSTDIARGMEHLVSKKIVHGDLACRNVLLTEDLKAKLTDFGMSRRLYTYQIYSSAPEQKCLLPWRWMSIEAIEDLNLSEKSDVWSFGVTLWEIFTLGEFPFEKLEWSLDIPRQIRQGLLKLSRPKYSNHQMLVCFERYKFNIMTECCNIEPKKRPTFLDLTVTFQKIAQENTGHTEELLENRV